MTELKIKDFIKEVGHVANMRVDKKIDQMSKSDLIDWIYAEIGEVDQEIRDRRPMDEIYYSKDAKGIYKPEGVPAELADVVLLCFIVADRYGIDLESAILEKQEYNKTRV